MIMSKTFDCVFITIDKQDRKSVRVANNYEKRLYVLSRDMKQILFQHDFQTAKTLDEILVHIERVCDVDDEDAVERFRAKIVRNKFKNDKTTADDVLNAIAMRKQEIDAVTA